MSLQTPCHDVLFQILVLISCVLAPLKLDGFIHISWNSILLPVIFGFLLMIARLLALLFHNFGRFDRYQHLEKGTLFMTLGQKWKSQIRWALAIAMTILSLIFFIIYLDYGSIGMPLYVPLIPPIIVSILIIEATLFSGGVTGDGVLMMYIMFGGITSGISLIVCAVKWSNTGNIIDGWYLIHLPVFIFYLISFLLIGKCLQEGGFDYFLSSSTDQFVKVLWIQGVFSLFTFHLLLVIKLDVAYNLMKFSYCFIPIWIWELTNFPVVGSIFGESFIWWYNVAAPILTISPSKRRELELQKYMPMPV